MKLVTSIVIGLALVQVAALSGTDSGAVAAQADPPGDVAQRGNSMLMNSPPRNDFEPSVLPEPEQTLGDDWRQLDDAMVTSVGDEMGLHVLVADAADGYAWRTAASLAEPLAEADQWIGQLCVTGSGDRAGVVYAPRTFANEAALLEGGAFAAIVDLQSGAVTKLPERVSLAYFNPACGTDETVTFSRLETGGDGPAVTRLFSVDATTGEMTASIGSPGQLTSPVWVEDRFVAAKGNEVVEIDDGGVASTLSQTRGTPFRLRPDAAGGVAYQVSAGDEIEVRRWAGAGDRLIGTASKGEVRVSAGADGRVFVTGPGAADLGRRLPADWHLIEDVPASAEVSSTGVIAVTSATNGEEASARTDLGPGDGQVDRAFIDATVVATGEDLAFSVVPAPPNGDGMASSTAVGGAEEARGPQARAASSNPDYAHVSWDPDRTCEVPRNDPRIQVYQPTPAMVEWAADLAVRGMLTPSRPNNRNMTALGIGSWTPQGMFPSQPLVGGGRVPAQVLLGILAQESNMWHASRNAPDATAGNTHQGGFYGNNGDVRVVNFAEADCGYGVAQVTTGMGMGDNSRFTPNQKLALTVDYATNVAAGLQILQEKWNQTRTAGLIANNGDPQYLENWWFAIWAYNSGFYPQGQDESGQWGVGWLNNPANPIYEPDRLMFLAASYDDARTPNKWSYPERVLGWAATSLRRLDFQAPGVNKPYRSTYLTGAWPGTGPQAAQPHFDTFCATAKNQCTPGASEQPGDFPNEPPGPCTRDDLKCWWHDAVTWADCASTCGAEVLRYTTLNPSPVANNPYPSNCSTAGLPSGALIIDDVPNDVKPAVGAASCASLTPNSGTFDLYFGSNVDSMGTPQYEYFPSKVDFHQMGGGYGGHFWYAHTRKDFNADLPLYVKGTWTLNREINGWARVMVHMPSFGAHTQQARYDIGLGDGTTQQRYLPQRTRENRWVSLGVMRFSGTPSVSLDSVTQDGIGAEDVAWDAVAFQPLSAKPANIVVALGDSFASGEGASDEAGGGHDDDYYTESNNNYGNASWNACRRSKHAWARKVVMPGDVSSLGVLSDAFSANYELSFLACSGARIPQLLGETTPTSWVNPDEFWESSGQYREMSQLDAGYLTPDTSLVMYSIGGNDVDWVDIVKDCAMPGDCVSVEECQTVGCGQSQFFLDNLETIIDVQSQISASVQGIHDRAPNAKIVLGGYPALFNDSAVCPSAPLTYYEKLTLNLLAGELADRTGATVSQLHGSGIDVEFVDPRSTFAGHAVCDTDQWLNGLLFGPLGEGDAHFIQGGQDQSCGGYYVGVCVSRVTLHPNKVGTTSYAMLVSQQLAGMSTP
jgi:hypothetical protein